VPELLLSLAAWVAEPSAAEAVRARDTGGGSRAAPEDAGGIRIEASVVRSRQAERHSGFLVWGREGPDWPDDVASAEPTRPGVGRVSNVRAPSAIDPAPAPSLHNFVM